jgi:hypothetical protein
MLADLKYHYIVKILQATVDLQKVLILNIFKIKSNNFCSFVFVRLAFITKLGMDFSLIIMCDLAYCNKCLACELFDLTNL